MNVTEKWYNNRILPLVPILETTKADEYNTKGFCFRWLIFKLWSLDSFSFELAVVADAHWGIGVIGIVPYLRWVMCIPCPESVSNMLTKFLYRKPKGE
jgi:hypothetical protein